MPTLDYATLGGKGTSYSRLSTLHTCARKYQIENIIGLRTEKNSVTFAYGHAVGAGVQEYFASRDTNKAILATMVAYDYPWSDLGTTKEQRAKKNVWYAILATRRFCERIEMQGTNEYKAFNGWEIAKFIHEGEYIPAVEIQFQVELDYGYMYEGHIDLVLYHPANKIYKILELKTSGFNEPSPALFQNSAQALSYSIVLDAITAGIEDVSTSSYTVDYMVYSAPAMDYLFFSFPKSIMQRMNWINSLIFDIEILEMYRSASEGVGKLPYPTNGASCYQFFKDCEYLGSCTFSDEVLIKRKPVNAVVFDLTDTVHFKFTLDEILANQKALSKDRLNIIDVTEIDDAIYATNQSVEEC